MARNDGAYLCPSCKGPTHTYDDLGPTDFVECEQCGCCFTVDVTTIPIPEGEY